MNVQPLAVGLEEAAAMIGIAPRTLRKWATERRLRSIKLGNRLMFRISDLEKLLVENERPAGDGPKGETIYVVAART
jgi:excisionase family DNA binding protein